MSSRSIIVISDIHVGAGPLDDCDKELEGHLCDFLHALSERDESVELVINGDFLEFIQAPPWKGRELESHSQDMIPLCHTEEQSVSKLRAIHQEHTAILRSLGQFLSSKVDNKLVIIPGNHDADFYWGNIRDEFTAYVSEADGQVASKIKFHLEQVYRPGDFPEIWIEHGHQYDPLNAFEVNGSPFWSEATPPIFKDVDGRDRLFECVGTRLLIKFLNRLDKSYPFVDNVKPFSRFITIFGLSVFSPSHFIKAAATMWGILRFLSSTTIHHRGDLMDSVEENNVDPRPGFWSGKNPYQPRKSRPSVKR